MKKHSTPPKMGNNGGTAFVRINGKRIYLGKYGSPDAAQNYARYIAEWSISPVSNLPVGKCTVDTLAVAFLDHAKSYYKSADYSNCKTALRVLLSVYSGCLVEAFGVQCMQGVQKQLTKQKSKYGKPFSRQHCNKLVNWIRSVFRWGVAKGLVPVTVAETLKYVPTLQKGRTTAPETIPRLDVSDATVQATLPHLLPIIATMVQVQRASGMRPCDVCRMKLCDIDQRGEVWLYKPSEHKTAWRGHTRVVALGEFEQSLILPYLTGKQPDEFIFSPKQAMQERCEIMERVRKKLLPSSCKVQKKNSVKHPKQIFKDFYDSIVYERAIRDSIKRANQNLPADKQIEHWTPYQLRHAKETELMRETKNPTITLAVMGQRSSSLLSRYDHSQVMLAVEEAKKRKNCSVKQKENNPQD
jgi:integrase